MRRVFPIWLVVVLGIASVNVGYAAGLQLACRVDGELAPIAAVDGKQIFVTVGGKTVAAPAGAEWTLTGEVRENARLLCWSPSYSISRRPEQPPGASLRAGELVAAVGVARGMRGIRSAGWQEYWEGHEAEPAVVVFAWLIDGKLTHIAAQAVPVVTSTTIFKRTVTIPLTEDEARGQPVLLRWDAQGWVPARPFLPSPRVQAALVDMMLNGRTDFTALSKKEVNEAGRGGPTLLHLAAEAGLASAVSGLVQAKAKVDIGRDGGRSTPLHWAAEKGREAAVGALLAAGAAQDSEDERGATPLLFASGGGHAGVVRELLRAHADADKRDDSGRTPMAAAINENQLAVAEILAEQDGDRGRQSHQLDRVLISKIYSGRKGMAKFLLARGAQTKAESRGRTALIAATAWDDPEFVDLLLRAGAPVSAATKNGITALMSAALQGYVVVVQHLLIAHAPADAVSADGRTALHYAAVGGDGETVKALLQAGASVAAADRAGLQPLDLALLYGHAEAARLLANHGARVDVKGKNAESNIEAAVGLDLENVLKRAIEDGWDIRVKLHGNWPILQVAKLCHAKRCAAVLEAAGADDVNGPTVVTARKLDAQPKLKTMVMPSDPRNYWSGALPRATVTVEVVIDGEGRVLFPRVQAGERALATEALAAIREWRFQPLRAEGKPAAARFLLPVVFNDVAAISENADVDVAPKPLKRVAPFYPRAALAAGVTGIVTVDFIVDESGRVLDAAIVLSSEPLFEEPALEALRQWKFSPAERNGQPVRFHLQVPIEFQLD
ncbi:TonB family protein [Horticoccus luteus]|uniref:TonB family protein n=1 Tax=Horticoccus luteus TaxID=2862869 RepID=A0A8F9TS71_9BACT|nr:TonB family protein [Horticoccus luteus]QYM78046.1 TonB family protein [Horticoccus luteus]